MALLNVLRGKMEGRLGCPRKQKTLAAYSLKEAKANPYNNKETEHFTGNADKILCKTIT